MAEEKVFRVDVPIGWYETRFVKASGAREAVRLAEQDDDDDVIFRSRSVSVDGGTELRVFSVTDDRDCTATTDDVVGAVEEVGANEDNFEGFEEWDGRFTFHETKFKREYGTMTTKTKEITQAAVSDAIDAAGLAMAAEFADTVREPMAEMLLREVGMEDSSVAKVVAGRFLRSRVGGGLFAAALGAAVPAIAQMMPEGHVRDAAMKFGQSLRVAGQMELLRPVVRVLSGPLQEFLVARAAGVGKVRVEAGESKPAAEVEAETAPKARAARAAR